MVFEPVPSLHNVLASVFMWTLLASFLVLPTTFPDIEIAEGSEKFGKMLHIARNAPLYVPSLLSALFESKKRLHRLLIYFKLTCGIQSTDQ
jgi:hypothetical protein